MPIYIETGSYYTAAEAAEVLGVRTTYVCQLLQAGQLIGFRVGKMSLIPASEVLERKKNPPPVGRPKSNKGN